MSLDIREVRFYEDLAPRIANALEKIAEKDFGGTKSIHEHRIRALGVIETTVNIVELMLRRVDDHNGILDEIAVREHWRSDLTTILNSLKS